MRVTDHLAGFEVLIGLHVRDVVIGLGQPADRWRLLDLQPPQKSLRLNKQGRTLKLTPELLIAGTTGISRPLGDLAKIAAYLTAGDAKKLARRLESDAKALYAFYRYGVLHRWPPSRQ